jgi:hypothetical protein
MTPLPPLAVGFMGLGTTYIIYGGLELFRIPKEDSDGVNRAVGLWGFWMAGFMQFFVGTYIFLGLSVFPTFESTPILYMAALAFTAYGVHWFALGLNKYIGGNPQVDGFMAIAFLWISVTGTFVFFVGGDYPVALLFALLIMVYVADIPASLLRSVTWTRIKGLWHLVTGSWLMYLMFASAVDFALGMELPL